MKVLIAGHNGKMGVIKWERGHPRHPRVAQEIVQEVLNEIVDQVVEDNGVGHLPTGIPDPLVGVRLHHDHQPNPSMNGMTT